MIEQDKNIVLRLKSSVAREKKESTGGVGHYFIEEKVLPLIERLNTQLTGIKEAGEPFEEFVKHFPQAGDDAEVAYVIYAGSEAKLTVGSVRRLAEALKEIEDE